MAFTEKVIEITSPDVYRNLFGANEKNLNLLQKSLQVQLQSHGGKLFISGNDEDVKNCISFVDKISELTQKKQHMDRSALLYAIELAKRNELDRLEELMQEVLTVNSHGKPIKCKTLKQRDYVKAIEKNALTLSIGPAGTGKTYLAMAMAIKALRNKEVDRIVLTRPAVEAGEKLGFLPGDLNQKVDPYLRPLFDALYEFVGVDHYQALMEKGIIEIAPLAYMRGRTLSSSFIILDEAQNTTPEQMKMFLTRFGNGSKVVVTGDLTQIDLQFGKLSGLAHAVNVLQDIDDISIIRLSNADVVRNELVQRIVKAYERYEHRKVNNDADKQ